MSEKTLADMFADEPADGTLLVAWVARPDGSEPRVVWRDDAEAKRWDSRPDEHWFRDSRIAPMTLHNILADATMVHAVVPLERSGLALVDEEE